ncbi:MAG: hypothetical protein IJO61_04270 [Oscillospiraceae bacterium]|nr:hypothetical protein [Oscillospiraceae bacterium]
MNSKGYDEDGKVTKLSESRGCCDPDSGVLLKPITSEPKARKFPKKNE